MSRRIRSIFEQTRKLALLSELPQKHGAILTLGRTHFSSGFNTSDFSRLANRKRHLRYRRNKFWGTKHAEMACFMGKNNRRDVSGGIMYVCRVTKDGKFAFSRPCPMCEAVLLEKGIKRVIYTLGENNHGIQYSHLDL